MNDVDALIRQLRALVRAREGLCESGASELEIEGQSAEIRRLQDRLAHQVRRMLEAA